MVSKAVRTVALALGGYALVIMVVLLAGVRPPLVPVGEPSGGWVGGCGPGPDTIGVPFSFTWSGQTPVEIVGVHLISVPGYRRVHVVGFDRPAGRGVVAAHFTGARLVETASQVRSGRVQTYLLMVQTAGPPGTVDAVAGFRIDYVADRSAYSFTIRSGVILTRTSAKATVAACRRADASAAAALAAAPT